MFETLVINCLAMAFQRLMKEQNKAISQQQHCTSAAIEELVTLIDCVQELKKLGALGNNLDVLVARLNLSLQSIPDGD